MLVKLKDGFSLDDTKVVQLQNILGDYFKTLQLGSAVEESDLIGEIYKNNEIVGFLEYVYIPFTSFYIPDNPADEVIERRDGTVITTSRLEYPVLNKILFAEVSDEEV